jgi:PIN domain nuclease of toxin-antitoxin system
MRLLLDTHAIVWYVDQDHLLSRPAHAAITDPSNELLISAATIWEISIKSGLGKLKLSQPFLVWMTKALNDLRASLLPITVEFAAAQAALPNLHRDPFDRMLAAQAMVESVPVVSSDVIFDSYGIARVW